MMTDQSTPESALQYLDDLPSAIEELTRNRDPRHLRDLVMDAESALDTLQRRHIGAKLVPLEEIETSSTNGHGKRKKSRLLKRRA